MTDGMGADIVVESSGTPQGLNVALELVRPRGTVALKTTCGLANEGINYTRAVVDEIRIQGSRCGPFDKAIEMLSAWEIPVRSLISHIYHLEQVEEAIITANTASKVIIDLDSKG
jgi:alcohol dehydrogenase